MNDKDISYSRMEAGFEFPSYSYRLDSSTVANFLKAVEDKSDLYQDTGLAPPMAVAATAMRTLSHAIRLPPGSIHVSQELSFQQPVSIGDSLTSHARISRIQKRGKLHILTVDLEVSNQSQKTVLTGKTSFILPQEGP